MARFDRVYRLAVGPAGQSGKEISALRITFDVNKDATEEPNQHTIRIYNLADTTKSLIEKPDNRALLYAGYAEEDGPLLMAAGAVVDAYTYFDAADRVTEITVADGFVEIRDTAVSLGYGAGVKASTIIADIARQMGLVLQFGNDLPDRSWNGGFSHYGPARDALHKVVRGTGLEWSIQNQVLQVIQSRGTTRRTAVVLNADSGLIGHPQRNREGAREKARVNDKVSGRNVDLLSASQEKDGWTVRSLLLPWLNPGDLVKMESRTIEGFWRADSVRHIGDTHGGDWITELKLVAL